MPSPAQWEADRNTAEPDTDLLTDACDDDVDRRAIAADLTTEAQRLDLDD
jgi:hypothetical protein